MMELKFHRRHLVRLSAQEKIASLTLDRSQNLEEPSDFQDPGMDNKFPFLGLIITQWFKAVLLLKETSITRRQALLTNIQLQWP